MTTPSSIPNLGSLILPFPQGWTFEYPEQCPVEGRGPGMEFASMSFSEASRQVKEDALRDHFEQTVAFTEHMLLAAASEKGPVHRTPSLLYESGGRRVYSAASILERGGVAGYFLQYVCLSLVSQHYISIGGEGAVEDAAATWDEVMRRAAWAHEA